MRRGRKLPDGAVIKGSCLCGSAQFEITGAIKSARYCHCANCRKFSGTAFAAWGLAQTSEFKLTTGDERVAEYDSGAGLRAFCSSCGSPLWYEPAGMPEYLGIPLGVLDGAGVPTPQMHVWMKSKVPWSSIADDLPQHETHP